MSDKLIAVGMHVYAGGFTVGVSKHFDVIAHLEHAAYGAEVVKLNYPEMPVYAGGPSGWPTSWPRGKARPRFVFANPPCAIWSGASAGRTTHWRDDPRLAMHHDIFNYALNVISPDVLAMESVPQSWTKGREHFDELAARAAMAGYSTTVAMHNAKWLGVPQNRPRIFHVYHRVAIDWDHPEFAEPKTVRQAISKLKLGKPIYELSLYSNSWGGGARPSLRKLWIDIALRAQPGERMAKVFDDMFPNPEVNARGHKIGRPGFIYSRAPLDRPCGVIMAGSTIHPTEPRVLHHQELAALCGFPLNYKWPPGSSFSDVSGYMSRGIMPPVGAWLAGNVAAAIERGRRLNDTSYAVLDLSQAPGSYYEV